VACRIFVILLVALHSSNSAAAVGRIAADFAVNLSGAATYRISIAVAEAANSMQPNVALVYSSHVVDGLAGVGWTLAGFSTIARCGLTRATNGEAQGVTFTYEDRFCLNGRQLIAISGGYGAENTQYRAEIHSHEKITSHGTVGTGPAHFIVRHPNGLTYYYGDSGTSRIDAPNTGEVRVWALTRIVDQFANEVVFNYNERADGEYDPKTITWGGTNNYKLKFAYEPRPDARGGYIAGSPWARTQRLTNIIYSFQGRQIFDYHLNYEAPAPSTGRSRLQRVTQCGYTDGILDCLPPTTFDWQDGVAGWSGHSSITNGYKEFKAFIDYDGDGDMEIISGEVGEFGAPNGNWQFQDANGSTLTTPIVFAGIPVIGTGDHFMITALEYNGDGLGDFMVIGSNGNFHVYTSNFDRSGGFCGMFCVYDTGIAPPDPGVPSAGAVDIDGDGRHELVYIGTNNTVYFHRNYTSGFDTYQNQAPISLPIRPGYGGGYSIYSNANLPSADFNGDGRQDLILVNLWGNPGSGIGAFYDIYLSEKDSYYGDTFSSTLYGSTYLSENELYVVVEVQTPDINGDGLSDFMFRRAGELDWYSMLSDGGGLLPPQATGIRSTATSQVVDYDGDGREDLLTNLDPVGSGGEGYFAFLSDGNSYNTTNAMQVPMSIMAFGPDHSGIDAADMNGDGYRDLLILRKWDGSKRTIRLHNGPRPDLVTEIKDGLENYHRPVYGRLSTAQSQYQADGTTGINQIATISGVTVRGTAPDSPDTRLIRGAPMPVVASYTENNGIGGEFTMTRKYYNAQTDLRGRGFLGFAQIDVLDSRTGEWTKTRYHQDYPYVGRMHYRYTERDILGPREEVQTWGNFARRTGLFPPDYYFVRLDASEDASYESDFQTLMSKVTHDFAWDPVHGVVSKDVEDIYITNWQGGPENHFQTIREVVSFDESLIESQWCLGRATQVDVTKTSSAAQPTSETRTTLSSYHPTCALAEERTGSTTDPGEQLVTGYVIDSSGRTQTITRDDGYVAAGTLERKTEFFYPYTWTPRSTSETVYIDGQSPAVVQRVWDEALGLVKSLINVQGLEAVWTYDGFGRVTREHHTTLNKDTNLVYTSPSACGGSQWCPSHSRYMITSTRSDNFWSIVHYDRFGRQIGEVHALLNGESKQAFEYDARGRLVKKNVPYKDTETAYWISYTHDFIGRRLTVSRPADDTGSGGTAVTTTAYWADHVWVVDANGNGTGYGYRPDDALKHVIEYLNGGGSQTTYYRHTPFGRLISIQDPDDAQPTTTRTYDGLGYLETQFNVDTGTWTYDYNVFGELISRQDSQDNTMTIEYDQLGRIKSRVEDIDRDGSDETTTWTYVQDAGASGFGLLDTITGPTDFHPTGYKKEHIYNSLSRLEQTKTTIDILNLYFTGYTYNTQGQVNSITYPRSALGFPKFLYSYTKGYLKKIEQDHGAGYTETIYEVTEMDALGREVITTSGEGFIDSVYTYDRANTRLKNMSSDVHLVSGTTSIQSYAYRWDKIGNLKERSDLNSGTTETFEYDALDRLTETRLHDQQTQSLTYHPDGRIQTKTGDGGYTGVGTYNYGNAPGSNAVTGIVGDRANSYHYDGNGNMDCRGDTTAACTSGAPIEWYSFNKPKTIYMGDPGNLNAGSLSFVYGPDRRRIKQKKNLFTEVKSIRYIDSHFEEETEGSTTRYRAFVYAGGRVVYALHEWKRALSCNNSTAGSNRYFYRWDHQGSVDRVTLWDTSGAGPVELSYDAFGKRRLPDWMPDDNDSQLNAAHVTNRGYTGHEHLDSAKLIHMNGRVQDPIIGRMISADPLIGDLTNPQTLNRYSYVMNNPLSFTDPSGFCNAGLESNEGGCAPIDEITVTAPPPPSQGAPSFGTVGVGASGGGMAGNIGDGSGLWLAIHDLASPLSMAEQNRLDKALTCRGGGSNCAIVLGDDLRRLHGKARLHAAIIKSLQKVAGTLGKSRGDGSQFPARGKFLKVFGGLDGALGFGGEGDIGIFLGRDLDGKLRFGVYVEYGPAYGYALSIDFGFERLTGLNSLDGTPSINVSGSVGMISGAVNVNPNILIGQPGRINGGGGNLSFGPLPLETFFSTTKTRTIIEFGGPD